MFEKINITIAQMNPTVGDLDGNADKILQVWRDNSEADLIVFSEMVLSAYPVDDLILKPSFMNEVHQRIDTLVEESKNHNAYAVIGTPWNENDTLYNAALVIGNGKIQHKVFTITAFLMTSDILRPRLHHPIFMNLKGKNSAY